MGKSDTYGSLKDGGTEVSDLSATPAGAEKLRALGERLRKARDQLSQSQWADRLGTTQQSIRRYERGERACDALFLMNVVDAFGIDARWLLTGALPSGAAHDDQASARAVSLDHEEMELLLDCYVAVEGILSRNGRHATREQKKTLAIKMLDEAKRLGTAAGAASPESMTLDSSENRA